MKKVVIAHQERIDDFERTAVEFFRAVLGMDYGECIVTDESRLSDFASCGLPEDSADATQSLKELYAAWDAWVVPAIYSRYGLADISTTILFVDLFELGSMERGPARSSLSRPAPRPRASGRWRATGWTGQRRKRFVCAPKWRHATSLSARKA